MNFSPDELLARVQLLADTAASADFYLWPRTPIGPEIQQKIHDRVGVSDTEAANCHSRPARIISRLRSLVEQKILPARFWLLDIACGDALILTHIKRAFPEAHCCGLDCNVGRFPAHTEAQRDGVRLYRGFLQHLFADNVQPPFDVILMLNTYRGWESADLRDHEQDLPQRTDAWIECNARFSFLTMTKAQLKTWRSRGYRVTSLGKGEDDSTLVCISKRLAE